jgi:hypothetical protein
MTTGRSRPKTAPGPWRCYRPWRCAAPPRGGAGVDLWVYTRRVRLGMRSGVLAVVVAHGCTSDEWPPLDDAGDGATSDTDPSTSGGELDGASLRVFEPMSASIHLIGEPVPLIAEVHDVFGQPTGYDAVFWSSDQVAYTLIEGAAGEVVLEPGVHAITATTELPGGDRLQSTIGGVRVQSASTGVYSGEAGMALTVDFQGMQLSPACRGPLEFTVDVTGETFTAESGSCLLDVVLAQFDVTYLVEGTISGSRIDGTIHYDFGLFQLPLAWTGSLENGTLDGVFAGMVPIPLVGDALAGGTLRAQLVTPYL